MGDFNNDFNNQIPFEGDIDEATMADLFGEDTFPDFSIPGGPLSPVHQQDSYPQDDVQQFGQAPATPDFNIPGGPLSPTHQQDSYPQDNVQQYGQAPATPNFDIPSGPLSPIQHQNSYPQDDVQQNDVQQYGQAPPAGEQQYQGGTQQYSQPGFDPRFLAGQASLAAQQPDLYQQGYGQQYETPFPGGDQQLAPQLYGPPFPVQPYAPAQYQEPLPPQQQQPYQAADFPLYASPAPVGETRRKKKTPKKRVSKKAPRKSTASPSADEADFPPRETRRQEKTPRQTVSRKAPRKAPPAADETDYSPITTLSTSSSASCTSPKETYWEFMEHHLVFVIMRMAAVCVALCREGDKEDDAANLGQIAVDFFSKEMWDIALKHYIPATSDGDDFEQMKACMADCIASLKIYNKVLAQELQDAVVLCGLWYIQQ